jgi:hypothetical protein
MPGQTALKNRDLRPAAKQKFPEGNDGGRKGRAPPEGDHQGFFKIFGAGETEK